MNRLRRISLLALLFIGLWLPGVMTGLAFPSPEIRIQSQLAGAVFLDQRVPILVTATDPQAVIVRVEFSAGYNDPAHEYWHPIGEDTDSSDGWGLVWDATTLREGTKVDLLVMATDPEGNTRGALVNNIYLGRMPIYPVTPTRPGVYLTPPWLGQSNRQFFPIVSQPLATPRPTAPPAIR